MLALRLMTSSEARSVVQPVIDVSGNPCQKGKMVNLLVMAPFPDTTGLEPARLGILDL